MDLVFAIAVLFVLFILPLLLPVVGAIRRSYMWFLPAGAWILGLVTSADDEGWGWVLIHTVWLAIWLMVYMKRTGYFQADEAE